MPLIDMGRTVSIIVSIILLALLILCVVIYFIIKKLIENYFKKDKERFKFELDKKLEAEKTRNDARLCITKNKFDIELNVYKKLLELYYNVVLYSNTLINPNFVTVSINQSNNNIYADNIARKLNTLGLEAQQFLFSNSAFIAENIYEIFNKINSNCSLQINAYFRKYNLSFPQSLRGLNHDDYERSRRMEQDLNEASNAIRLRLDSLTVVN